MTVYTVFAWGFGSGAVATLVAAVAWHRRCPAAQLAAELERVTRQCG